MLEKWPVHSRFTAIVLAATLLLGAISSGLLLARGKVSSHESQLAYNFVICVVFAYWLERDTRQTRVMRVWDRAWFFAIGWPVVVPYYLVKTRGTRGGLSVILAWVGVYAIAHIAAIMVRLAMPD